ncbi:hypothetical protein B7P43_G11710 [Cryptotermes secundus]|uniref:Uncharacterized protein n=1 Tax=Cryptotermes secundus TaxID=105785 RepID=A0A2J7PRS8_9NEOP|nr:hypothetical protein B7P43_G11710 [Cryptotermes secundus]
MKCVNNIGISENVMQQGRKEDRRLQQMLENVDITHGHYLVENENFLAPHTYFLQYKNSDTYRHPPCKAKIENLAVVSIILHEIKYRMKQLQ